MAAKQEVVDLAEIFSKYTEEKKIDRSTLVSVLEDSFRSVISKQVGSDENYDVIINPAKGDLEIYRNREVVADDDFEDENTEISLSDVRKIEGNEDMNVGDTYSEIVNFSDFGRRAVLNLRQTLGSKILDLQKDNLYNKYKEKVGTIVTGEVYQVWKKELLVVDEDNNEMSLPKTEQIPSDFFRKGDTVMAVVAKVDNRNNDPKIILSRTSPLFLQRLFERDVPEIADGLITIKKIARIPGERAKVAVESYDERIDAVGACVGMKGSRIHGIVRELRNENIDVIQYSDNLKLFISRALSPARISDITVYEEHQRADVFLNSEEISLAIGKGGNNIKLANMLTDFKIDVFRDDNDGHDSDDCYLDEFLDEIDGWVIETLKRSGYSTAKEVLATPRQELIDKTDLEEETIDDLLNIINEEFGFDSESGSNDQ
ncbi:MAG: transcription termination factor NusA [Paludibacteraceae bacterium]|nr:transcription termination factor NusA [Paludibacteraceae bacterium]